MLPNHVVDRLAVGAVTALQDTGTPDELLGTEGGLTNEARIFVALTGLGALALILLLLRRRQLRGKYALVWTGLAVSLGVLGLFPGLLTAVADAVGIYYPPALFLLVATGFLFAVVIQFSWELSRLQDRGRVLAEELALLDSEVREMRRRLPADGPGDGATDPGGPTRGG